MGLGNQQERLEADRRWFGGMFDGEGHIGASYGTPNRRNGKRSPFIGVRVCLTNTSEVLVGEAIRIMDEAGIAYHVQKRPPTIGRKDVWLLTISGMKRARRFLDVFTPYLRAKRVEAEMISDFIASRMQQPIGAPYTEKEVDLFLRLREMHGYRLRESPESIQIGRAHV